jgi:predicted RNA binding protein YcfA (HicA-like mRNA interferase family)
MGGVVNLRSKDVCRFLERHGFVRNGGKGDHVLYWGPGSARSIQVPFGGCWSNKVPRKVIAHIAEAMARSANEVIQAVREG